MSDTIAKDCLIHYNNQHIQLRRDFLGICAFDRSQFKKKEAPNQECMAMILRLFETLTDHQKQTWYLKAVNAKNAGLSVPPEPKEYPLQLAYGAIATLLYHTYEESTIRCCIAYLLSLGYIRRTQARKNSIPVYCLNIEMVQEALKKQAEKELSGVEFNSQSQVLNSTAKRRISTAKAVNSTPGSPNSDPQGCEFNSNNIYKINDKDKKEESTLPTVSQSPTASSDDEDAHALSLSFEQERKTDVYTDRALVCHSLANGQSVHPHTESPATAGVSPVLGGNDPSPAQMVAKEQASPLASGTQRIGHASSTSQSCSLCSEQEDIQPCRECGTRLCFEHRRDFPSETEPTHILCVECLRQHNRAMVETPSANTELVSALGPVSEKAEPLIASTTATSQPAPAKAARKPRAPRKPKTPLQDLDEETQARVVKVLDCLDSWRQETSGNPDQCYSREDPQAIAAIVKILPLKPTPKRLRQVCDAMWNTPRDQRTGFHWQKHMTVVNICKQYDTQSLELDAKEKKATHYTNISILPVTPVKDDDDDNLVFLGPRSQRTQMRKRG